MSVSELRWAGSQAGGPAAHGKTAYLPYIDGLRAWAVLSVMLYHLDARWLPGGFAGVDIFFVISGFVVSVSVANRGPMSLGPFLCFFMRGACGGSCPRSSRRCSRPRWSRRCSFRRPT